MSYVEMAVRRMRPESEWSPRTVAVVREARRLLGPSAPLCDVLETARTLAYRDPAVGHAECRTVYEDTGVPS
jgi:hypothetical protein